VPALLVFVIVALVLWLVGLGPLLAVLIALLIAVLVYGVPTYRRRL
jgi:hypothetical protein